MKDHDGSILLGQAFWYSDATSTLIMPALSTPQGGYYAKEVLI
jgi:hypothetical protein